MTLLAYGRATADAAPLHGGRLDEARRLFPQAPEPWIDLSTGVNPHAYPLPHIPQEAWTRLPDASALAALEVAAARAYRAPAHVEIVAGAGTQAFIQALPQLVPARRVAVLGFTYAEHGESWRRAGARVDVVEDVDALVAADVAVVVNPNNPDGRIVAPQRLAEIARSMAARGRLMIVDEAFMDFTPQHSLAPAMPEGALALRSFGKAYGLPGVRLGFALCAPALAASLRTALGPWNVSGPALVVGAAALGDADWLRGVASTLAQESERLDALLQLAGFELVGGASLYRLAAHDDAATWFGRLGGRGILTRRFPQRPLWLRFGLPATRGAWARFAQALGVSDGS
jgi:cobalamin biosynthesis protein CobC